jgi:site-specific recombinase XerD
MGNGLLGAAPGSANRLLIMMRYIYNLTLRWEVPGIKSNPCKGIPLMEENNKLERYLSVVEAQRLYEAVCKSENNQDVRMHDLRHSFASLLINSVRTLYEVQHILGHTQVKTTQRYAHLSQDTLLAAANSATTSLGAAMMPVVHPVALVA